MQMMDAVVAFHFVKAAKTQLPAPSASLDTNTMKTKADACVLFLNVIGAIDEIDSSCKFNLESKLK